jgi:hypothetical protein
MTRKLFGPLVAALTFSAPLAGCGDKDPEEPEVEESTGEEAEEAAEETGEAIEGAADDTVEAVDEAEDEVDEEL